jgi:hypothetical protein
MVLFPFGMQLRDIIQFLCLEQTPRTKSVCVVWTPAPMCQFHYLGRGILHASIRWAIRPEVQVDKPYSLRLGLEPGPRTENYVP